MAQGYSKRTNNTKQKKNGLLVRKAHKKFYSGNSGIDIAKWNGKALKKKTKKKFSNFVQ